MAPIKIAGVVAVIVLAEVVVIIVVVYNVRPLLMSCHSNILTWVTEFKYGHSGN